MYFYSKAKPFKIYTKEIQISYSFLINIKKSTFIQYLFLNSILIWHLKRINCNIFFLIFWMSEYIWVWVRLYMETLYFTWNGKIRSFYSVIRGCHFLYLSINSTVINQGFNFKPASNLPIIEDPGDLFFRCLRNILLLNQSNGNGATLASRVYI